MHKYKTSMNRQQLEGLEKVTEVVMCYETTTYQDKMWLCLIAEIKSMAYKKLGEVKKQYSLTFTAAQAMALYGLAIDMADVKSDLGNKLHTIRNEIRNQYSFYK